MPSASARRLVLRPGTPVMARSPGVLQVGLDEPTVRGSDTPANRELLAALARPSGVPLLGRDLDGGAEALLDRLRGAGLVLAVPDDDRVPDRAEILLRAQFGPDAVRRRRARARADIAVHAPPEVEPPLEDLLEQAGVRRIGTGERAAVHLVISSGPVDRELIDPLVRGSLPHLVMSGAAQRRRLGPFVEPGRTACLRCVDAHEALHDARRPLLLAQAARAARDRPPPLDPVVDLLVLAWAVRDLARYLEGETPSTWSTTFDIAPSGAPESVQWGRHPHCGCAWDAPALFG